MFISSDCKYIRRKLLQAMLFSVFILLIELIFASNTINAQNNITNEYIFSIPPVYEDEVKENFVTLYVIALKETNVTVEVPSQYMNKQKATANETLVFQIDASFGQVAKWDRETKVNPPNLSNIYKNQAIRVTADNPILCYVICQYYWTSDGFLAFPIHQLNNEYIISSYPDMGSLYGHYFPSEFTVVGTEDNTDVEITIGNNIATLVNFQDSIYYADDKIKIKLDKGDVCLIMSGGKLNEYPDLSGSKVKANKPISVVSGNVCANIPLEKPTCDYIVTMELPVSVWQKEYLVPPITFRKLSQLVRVYTKEDSTIIYKNFKPVDTIYANENRNFIEMRLNGLSSPIPAVISSNNPIYVNFLYSSWTDDSSSYGDPFTMPIFPYSMFNKSVTFSTPQKISINSFDSNYVNIVYKSKNENLLENFEVKFINERREEIIFEKTELQIISSGEFLSSNNNSEKYFYFTMKLPKLGQYTISSDEIFACYLFGFSDFASYGIPTFPLYAFASKTDILPPIMTADFECDGSVINGKIKDLPEYGNERSNLHSVVFFENESKNVNFSYSPFQPGLSSETYWKLNVENILDDANALIKVTDCAGNYEVFNFKYYGINGLELTPLRNNICVAYEGVDTLIFELYNPKDTTFPLKLSVFPNDGMLKIISDNEIELAPKSKTKILFETKYVEKKDFYLIVEKCSLQDTIWLPVNYQTNHYPIDVLLKSNKAEYSIGDTLNLALALSPLTETDNFKNITQLNLKFDLYSIFLDFNEENFITVPSNDIVIKDKKFHYNSDSSKLFFDITLSINVGLDALNYFDELTICNLQFLLILPSVNKLDNNLEINPKYREIVLTPEITTNYSPCAGFYPKTNQIKVLPLCAEHLRFINISAFPFELNMENMQVNYSLGIDCFAEVKIYNYIGEVVHNLLANYSKAGEYTVDIEKKQLASGIYFCELSVPGLFRKVIAFHII